MATSSFFAELWAARNGEAHEISDGIVLGSVDASVDSTLLQRWSISHVLVVHPTLEEKWPDRFKYKRLPLEDAPTANLLELLPEAFEFLEDARQQGGCALVHCTRGISRSPSVVIAFLVLLNGMSFAEARRWVEQKRPVIYPNHGFQAQLQHFELLAANVANHLEWSDKLTALRANLPLGDLTRADASFRIRDAISRIVRLELEQLDALCRRASTDITCLQKVEPWKGHGIFFELLHKYWSVPSDRSLVDVARPLAKRLAQLAKSSGAKLGAKAAAAVASELEAWVKMATRVFEAELQGRPVPGFAIRAPPSRSCGPTGALENCTQPHSPNEGGDAKRRKTATVSSSLVAAYDSDSESAEG